MTKPVALQPHLHAAFHTYSGGPQVGNCSCIPEVILTIHAIFGCTFNSSLLYFQVNVCLECKSTSLRTLKRSYIRCSAQATITHLKKFIAKKVLNGIEKYREVSVEFKIYCFVANTCEH